MHEKSSHLNRYHVSKASFKSLKSFNTFRKVIFLSLAILVPMMLISSALALEEKGSIQPKGYERDNVSHYLTFSNTTEEDDEKHRKTHLSFYSTPRVLKFNCKHAVSIYIMNDTQFALYLEEGNITYSKNWRNVVEGFEVAITFSLLTEEWGWDTYFEYDEEGKKSQEIAYCHLVIINEVDESNKYHLIFNQYGEFHTFLDDFSRWAIIIAFLFHGISLILHAQVQKRDEEEIKAHILNNYGIGLLFGAVATTVWEVYHRIRAFRPEVAWNDALRFDDMPIEVVSTNYLSFVSMVALGFSLLFMSNTVEKDVQQRKIPYLTYFLLITEILLLVGMFAPIILIGMFFIWIAALVLVGFNIMGSYLRILTKMTGEVKKRMLMLVCGVFFTVVFVPMRIFIHPEYICNFLAVVSIRIMYKGLKFD